MIKPAGSWIDGMTENIIKIGQKIGTITSYLVLGIIGVTVFEVIMRYYFNRPTGWVHETSEMIFAVMFLIGGAYAVIYDGHVKVDAIYNHLPRRGKIFSECLTFLFFSLYLAVLTHQGTLMAIDSIRMLERSQSPWGPYIFPVIAIVPIASFFMIIVGVAKFIHFFKNLRQDTDNER